MARVSIPYLLEKADGRRYWQPARALREAGWVTERLHGTDAEQLARAQELAAQLQAWRKGEAAPNGAPVQPRRRGKAAAPGTVGALIEAYEASRFYKDCAARTRDEYDDYLAMLKAWAGDKPARAITAKMAQDLYDARLPSGTARANALMRVGRLLWNCGPKLDVTIAGNPFASPRLIAIEKSGKPWTRAAIAAFIATADRLGLHGVGDAVALNEWLGQREGDILALPRTALTADDVAIRQNKTGAWVVLPLSLVPQIKARLALMRARAQGRPAAATTAIVNDATGLPYNAHTFRHDVVRVRAALAGGDPKAGIAKAASWETDYVIRGRADQADARSLRTDELIFKNLRHSAVLFLNEAGTSDALISAVTGHTLASIKQILETYMVRSKAMAVAALQRRLDHERPLAAKEGET